MSPAAGRSPSRRTGTGWDETITPFVDGDTRVLVAGDWHGSLAWAQRVLHAAADLGVHTVLQLGDMGMLWPGVNENMARKLGRDGLRTGTRLVFVDGNHDPHDRLRRIPTRPDGLARIEQTIFYAPRGARWTWAGRRFAALGGAYSVDRARRIEGKSLWADLEEITEQDVARVGTDPVDVLVTHEAPAGVLLPSTMGLTMADARRSARQRNLVRQAAEATGAALVMHGHWHHRHTSHLPTSAGITTVVGLGKEYEEGNWVLLDLTDLSVHDSA